MSDLLLPAAASVLGPTVRSSVWPSGQAPAMGAGDRVVALLLLTVQQARHLMRVYEERVPIALDGPSVLRCYDVDRIPAEPKGAEEALWRSGLKRVFVGRGSRRGVGRYLPPAVEGWPGWEPLDLASVTPVRDGASFHFALTIGGNRSRTGDFFPAGLRHFLAARHAYTATGRAAQTRQLRALWEEDAALARHLVFRSGQLAERLGRRPWLDAIDRRALAPMLADKTTRPRTRRRLLRWLGRHGGGADER